jgi:dihydrofolate reductase
MHVTWSPAVTLDGYIAKADGDSDWVSEQDSELFRQLVQSCGCVIVGRRTYEQYKDDVFPIDGAVTFVWTTHPETGEARDGVVYVGGKPEEVVKSLEAKGFNQAVLAGGGEVNNAFVAAGVVDTIIATMYPMLLGRGIRLLAADCELQLALQESKAIDGGIIRNIYRVVR